MTTRLLFTILTVFLCTSSRGNETIISETENPSRAKQPIPMGPKEIVIDEKFKTHLICQTDATSPVQRLSVVEDKEDEFLKVITQNKDGNIIDRFLYPYRYLFDGVSNRESVSFSDQLCGGNSESYGIFSTCSHCSPPYINAILYSKNFKDGIIFGCKRIEKETSFSSKLTPKIKCSVHDDGVPLTPAYVWILAEDKGYIKAVTLTPEFSTIETFESSVKNLTDGNGTGIIALRFRKFPWGRVFTSIFELDGDSKLGTFRTSDSRVLKLTHCERVN